MSGPADPTEPVARLYDPHEAAERYYPWWEESGFFRGNPEAPGRPFVIVIPPPNVTGSLHMGHALDLTLQDVLVRYHRMAGDNTVWIPGTDHAGIATQWIVEKELAKEGRTRHDIGREAFLERTWAWKATYGGTITRQLRRLGASCDWTRERFTLDEGLTRAVREAFVRLYEQGLIYRDTRLIHWDPVGQTALSDLEVVHEEGIQGEMWSFAYPLTDGSGEIVVATTRPETMLGDTAVAVHPEDPRYAHLVGRTVRHPFCEREVPIIADAILVDPAFGTGAVKVTPAHDPNDYEVGKRHGLAFVNILKGDGTLNSEGGPFAGMDRFEAREAVKERMAQLGLDRGSKPHVMAIGRSQRSGAFVEPMVSTQWFVRMKPLAAPATAAVEHGFTRFVPKQWENTYFSWLRGITDWCISRQLWWGHRIPAWYCQACGHITVAREDPEACARCGSDRIEQDPDVLDTWFSSALWPFSTLGWPERTVEMERWYPTTVLVTAYDIIFFWVARMVFSGIHHTGSVPFRDVCIHGLIRDAQGQKMSKTKGNAVDPLLTIDRYGADAFRFALTQATTQGSDIAWEDGRVESARRYTNKLWQAFRFVTMNLGDEGLEGPVEPSVYDRWILARLGEAVRRVREAFESYRFNDAANEIYAFTWDELCDWYLELAKGVLYGDATPGARRAARRTLVEGMGAVARLVHPIMPFLGEEIWQHLPGTTGSVMQAPFPRPEEFPSDPAVLDEIHLLQEAVVEVRRIRSEMELSPRIGLTLQSDGQRAACLGRHLPALRTLAHVTRFLAAGRPEGVSAAILVGGERAFVALEGVIDVEAERARLDRAIEKTTRDLEAIERRLSSPGFAQRAPAEVVESFRGKRAAARDRVAALEAARALLETDR
ncbi:MAG: valine--tRNA ligase [Deltaproteobacteria bacterium]|nr:valine--tRNA ligase [Deltaproteobacteria bacterium]